MANYANAYTIAFEGDDIVYNNKIMTFLKEIEKLMNSPQKRKVVRTINGKTLRVHAYEWSTLNDDYVVIPFGKLKDTNKPYGMDETTQKLIELPNDMFDVNCFAYHSRYRIAIITTNKQGPTEYDIECYLNSYIPQNEGYRIHLKPIKRNIGIEKIRNATCARSLTINLNLGRPLNDFFFEQVNEDGSIKNFLLGLLNHSKDSLQSKTFSFTIGLGHDKNATLDIASLLELLDSINIESNCVKEILVNYKDNTSKRIDTAKLKENNVIYKVHFDLNATRLSAEYIKNNLEEVLTNERNKYYTQINDYFCNSIELEEYKFEENFDGAPIV